MARSYTQLTATSVRIRCLYLMPNSMQCLNLGEQSVTDTSLPANQQVYQCCELHHKMLLSLDGGYATSSGNQKNDQQIDHSTAGKNNSDDIKNGTSSFFWSESTKDQKNRGIAGAFNTQEQVGH